MHGLCFQFFLGLQTTPIHETGVGIFATLPRRKRANAYSRPSQVASITLSSFGRTPSKVSMMPHTSTLRRSKKPGFAKLLQFTLQQQQQDQQREMDIEQPQEQQQMHRKFEVTQSLPLDVRRAVAEPEDMVPLELSTITPEPFEKLQQSVERDEKEQGDDNLPLATAKTNEMDNEESETGVGEDASAVAESPVTEGELLPFADTKLQTVSNYSTGESRKDHEGDGSGMPSETVTLSHQPGKALSVTPSSASSITPLVSSELPGDRHPASSELSSNTIEAEDKTLLTDQASTEHQIGQTATVTRRRRETTEGREHGATEHRGENDDGLPDLAELGRTVWNYVSTSSNRLVVFGCIALVSVVVLYVGFRM